MCGHNVNLILFEDRLLQILVQSHQSPSKVSVAELLQQLTVTQAELENIKVRFDLFALILKLDKSSSRIT